VLAAFGPSPSFTRVGATGPTFPTPITVTLTGAAQGATTVTVTSNSAAVTVVGGGVTIPSGQTSAPVQLVGVAQAADVTLTATLGASSLDAHVRSLGAAEVPSTVMLTPSPAIVAPNTTKAFTVTLDVPAPAGGTTVTLSASAGTVAPSVTVPANQIAAQVQYTAPAAAGTATLTATLGASMSTAMISIGVDHLVLNEVDYDMVSTDNAEYIEIYNPTGADYDLTGVAVVLVNGANSQTYDTIDLSSAGTLPAGGYLVIVGPTVTVPAAAIKVDPGWTTDKIQNGAPDGIALVDTMGPRLLDALSYEGSITAAVITGFAGPVSLVEGTAESAADSNSADGSLCRSPDGHDSDNASVDWRFCTTKTPGTANP
jgi:hypothetical protein